MAEGKEAYTDKDGDNGDTANLGFYVSEGFDSLNSVFSEQQQQQQGGKGTFKLKLTRSSSFIKLLEQELIKNSKKKMRMTNEVCTGSTPSPSSEKLKASNFPAKSLKIGHWEHYSENEGDLVAKCYYAKRKLVWEVLYGELKSKIEIHWSDIVGIRADMSDDKFEVLDIELNHAPKFYRETNPQPRKHTIWLEASDFTDGQALKCRRHTATFGQGHLDKIYKKLLQCDPNLLMLSEKPFPTQESLYFLEDIYRSSGFRQESWVPSIPMLVSHAHHSNVPISVIEGQHLTENQGLGNGFASRENESGMSDFYELAGERFNQNTRIQVNHVEDRSQVPTSSYGPFIENQSQVSISSNEIMLFENTLPIMSANLINVRNNIGYQPDHTTTNFGISSVPPMGNNIEYQIDGHGNYEVSPQLLYPSPYENQVLPQLFQDYEYH